MIILKNVMMLLTCQVNLKKKIQVILYNFFNLTFFVGAVVPSTYAVDCFEN